jgi:glutaredoxin
MIRRPTMFTMKGCPPCALVKRMLTKNPALAARIEIADLDTIEGDQISQGHRIQAVPTFLKHDGKGPKNRHVGPMTKVELEAWLEGT